MTWWVGLVDASGGFEVQSDGRCVSKYSRKYLVRTDSGSYVDEPAVAAAVGIVRGSPLAADTNAICYSATIDQGPEMTRPPFQARFATYLFSTDAPLPDADDDDPTTRRTLWSISPTIQTRYITKDRHGKLIVNSAGQPFDGGIPVDVRLGTVTATRNIDATGYDKNAVLANSGKYNDDTFLGAPAGTVQVDISAQEQYQGGWHYWAETYTFTYDKEGVQPKTINAGFYKKTSADCVELIVNADRGTIGCDASPLSQEPVNEPEPLYDAQSEIDDPAHVEGTVVPISDRPDGCTFVVVDYYESYDFDSFGL